MPGTGRTDAAKAGAPGAFGAAGRRGLRAGRVCAFLTAVLTCTALPAMAQVRPINGAALSTYEVINLALFFGIIGAAILSAIWLIRERGRTAAENISLRERVAELSTALQRSDAILDLGDQRVLVWYAGARKPDLVGSLAADGGVPEDRAMFLAFGRWLTPRSAASLEHAMTDLRDKGRDFETVLETQKGTVLEVHGRHAASHVAVRFTSLSRARREHGELKLEHERVRRDRDVMMALLDALDMPFWLRGPDGRLQWVNEAYSRAVDAPGRDVALHEEREILGTQAREAIARGHLASPRFSQELSTVIGGDRVLLSVTDVTFERGAAGIACDISEVEAVREEYERTVRSHADTLDQLNTAVAIFDVNQKLRFFNQAFQKLWQLDTAFLESHPDNTILLDRLRSEGMLAEQPEWRRWKETLLHAYRAVDPKEHLWHLPDGRTLRVVANPQPKGGVTWVFENLTEQINLESRYQTAVRVQGETLDNLAEGVAVFGPDGRVRLSNPAFSRLWNLPEGLIQTNTHISAIRAACQNVARANPWADLVATVTGFDENREDMRGQVELNDGNVLRYAVIHLPNGQVMTTFVDVTDSVNVERALKDKNEALQRADRMKNDFVQHVSYELRSPLTNIIGFTELLSHEVPGPLTGKQREYVDHIGSSSSVLLTIVNDILDLATVDAGIMELEIGEVRVEETVRAAGDLVTERLRDDRLALAYELDGAPASFHADEHRVRQVLFNLLSNAANYAPEGSTITMRCRATSTGVEFAVHDQGPGMSQEIRQSIFRRFEPRSNGGRRRGAGLGLSIVKSFVELHGGNVEIDSGSGMGTTVICRFPRAPQGARFAAE